jgi:HEAT repeat protein
LIEALQDTVAQVRQNAAQSLGKTGADSRDAVLSALTAALKDENRGVRLAAAEAVTLVPRPLAAADLPSVLELLKHQDVEARAYAARALGQLPSEAKQLVPVLSALCQAGTDKPLRLAALASLAQFGAEAKPALAVLVEAIKGSDAEVRQAAGQALAGVGREAKEAVPALKAALADPDKATRKTVVVALGKIGPEAKDVVPVLGKMLDDEKERDLRLEIVTTLGEIGKAASAAAPHMVRAFGDEKLNEELAQEMRPMGKLLPDGKVAVRVPNPKQVLKKVDAEFQAKNVAALTKIGRPAVPALMKGLGDNDLFVRWGCIKVLANLGPDAKAAARSLSFNVQRETIPDIRQEANAALQKVMAKR